MQFLQTHELEVVHGGSLKETVDTVGGTIPALGWNKLDCVSRANILGEITRNVTYTAIAVAGYALSKKKAAGALWGGIAGNVLEGSARTAVNTKYLEECKASGGK